MYPILNVINGNTKFVYAEALKDKTQSSVLDALETIRRQALKDERPLKVVIETNISERDYE